MLLNIPNIEQDADATPNLFNERFGLVARVLNGNIEADNIKDKAITAAKIADDVFGRVFPVGSLYFNATDDANPSSLLGYGTWEAYSVGRMPVGYDAGQTEFNAPGKTGGAKTVALSEAQMPSHAHAGSTDVQGSHNHSVGTLGTSGSYGFKDGPASSSGTGFTSTGGAHAHNFGTDYRGGNQAHENMPPFITVYIWRRIS